MYISSKKNDSLNEMLIISLRISSFHLFYKSPLNSFFFHLFPLNSFSYITTRKKKEKNDVE